MKNKPNTPNSAPKPQDQRSTVKNPNNPQHQQANDNKSNQQNPNHKPSKK